MKQCAIWLIASVVSAVGAEPSLKIAIYEQEVLCVRVHQLPEDFAKEFRSIQPTNRIAGVVVDLRFTAASLGANLNNLASVIKTPVAVLVNGQTSAAAWDWAANLRRTGGSIVIGSPNPAVNLQPDIYVTTRGEDELKFQQNPFANIAVNASQPLSNTNAFLPFVDHTSEADLVRQRVKDGEEDNVGTPRPEAPQVIRDPALARAVDWLRSRFRTSG